MNSTVLVIVPTRGRPEAVMPFVGAWLMSEPPPEIELVFVADDDDPALDAYRAAIDDVTSRHKRIGLVEVPPSGGMVKALNTVVTDNLDRFDAFGFLGDDCRVRGTPWPRILDALETRPRIVYANDGYQGEAMPTHVFMTSDIVRTLGFMVLPDVQHCLVDIAWQKWGEAIDRLHYLGDDVVIEHLHPWAKPETVAWDEGYERVNNDESMERDREAFEEYLASDRYAGDVEKLKGLL